ncbi:MAG: bifunctional oligoribonuclease/PAP phosphatase NrnA [Ruminococcaceae bacterium]|nr:bifunctional oligoribonuclease/PAP phosphatase NrnA [Oscillospiraceae bacterium]
MTQYISDRQAADLLKKADNILLLAHQYPDGDTLGSNFALCLALRSMGKRVRVLCGDPIPEKYDYMTAEVPMPDFEPEYICALDVADPKLLGPALQAEYGHRVDLCIDHHSTNVGYATHSCVDASCAAAAMVILRIIRLMGVVLTPAIATCIYTGIATDSGCFKYSNADAEAHRMAADCMDVGVPYEMINRVNFDMKSRARIELERLALDGMEFHHDGRVAMMTITNEMVAKSGAKENDMEGLPPIPRQIEGVWVGITLRQKADGNYKISVRTGTHADASAICVLLGGGGHNRAAGCAVDGTLEEAKAAVLKAAEEALPRLITG